MEKKKIDRLWSISLMVIGLANVVIGITNAFDRKLPDALIILMCIILLAAGCTLVYTSLKKWQQNL